MEISDFKLQRAQSRAKSQESRTKNQEPRTKTKDKRQKTAEPETFQTSNLSNSSNFSYSFSRTPTSDFELFAG